MNKLMLCCLLATFSIMAAASMLESGNRSYSLTREEKQTVAKMRLPYDAYHYATIGSTAQDSVYVANLKTRSCSYGTCWGE